MAYIILAPLDPNGRIDAEVWRRHRDACRVARLRPGKEQELGHLVHRPGGSWGIHYEGVDASPDETGYHFAEEQFVSGEYVSVREGNLIRAFKVSAVSRL